MACGCNALLAFEHCGLSWGHCATMVTLTMGGGCSSLGARFMASASWSGVCLTCCCVAGDCTMTGCIYAVPLLAIAGSCKQPQVCLLAPLALPELCCVSHKPPAQSCPDVCACKLLVPPQRAGAVSCCHLSVRVWPAAVQVCKARVSRLKQLLVVSGGTATSVAPAAHMNKQPWLRTL